MRLEIRYNDFSYVCCFHSSNNPISEIFCRCLTHNQSHVFCQTKSSKCFVVLSAMHARYSFLKVVFRRHSFDLNIYFVRDALPQFPITQFDVVQ